MDKVSPPAFDLDQDKLKEFDLGDHSADQPTQGNENFAYPESGKANPNKTGTY